jgi:hypothetical protein
MVAALEYGEAFAKPRVAFETRDPTELVMFLEGCGACRQKDVARLVELLAADPGAWEAVGGGEITVVKIANLCSELA